MQSRVRVIELEAQLEQFDTDLSQFDRVKQDYELRLNSLQEDKRRIKAEARSLLEMVKEFQHDGDRV